MLYICSERGQVFFCLTILLVYALFFIFLNHFYVSLLAELRIISMIELLVRMGLQSVNQITSLSLLS